MKEVQIQGNAINMTETLLEKFMIIIIYSIKMKVQLHNRSIHEFKSSSTEHYYYIFQIH